MEAVPEFTSPEDEIKFWREHSVLEFVSPLDLSDFLKLGGNKSVVVALRMEPVIREQTRMIARDVGKNYQTLMREWIHGGLKKALEEKHAQREKGNPIERLTELVMEMREDLEEIKGSIQLPEFREDAQGDLDLTGGDISDAFSIFPAEFMKSYNLNKAEKPF